MIKIKKNNYKDSLLTELKILKNSKRFWEVINRAQVKGIRVDYIEMQIWEDYLRSLFQPLSPPIVLILDNNVSKFVK